MEYCTDTSSSTWECARAITLGIISAVTFLLAAVAVHRVIKAQIRKRTFGLNLIMLIMCLIQSNLDWIELLGKREARIQLMSMTLRSLETNVACSAYATFILENRNAPVTAFWLFVFPFSSLALAVTLIIFVFACLEPEVSCEHPLWLAMGAIQLAVSLIFVVVGLLASKEVNHLLASSAVTSELMKKRRDLWLLMAAFFIASLAQVIGDAWRQDLYQKGNSCRHHETHLEEAIRTVLFVISFDLPVWGILIVFYYLQRHSFNPNYEVEVPSVQLLRWEDIRDADGEQGIGDIDEDEESLSGDDEHLALA
jgi:hypothetical protein